MWTKQQVANLVKRQSAKWLHPYTCSKCSEELQPTQHGWVCEKHGLVQKWAHNEDLNGNFPDSGFTEEARKLLFGS